MGKFAIYPRPRRDELRGPLGDLPPTLARRIGRGRRNESDGL